MEAYAVLRDASSRADYDRRQAGTKPRITTHRAAASHDFLLHAGPVWWSDERATTSRPGESEYEMRQRLLRILIGRWGLR
ncbi:MAG: hypothetical protein QOF35_1629 [Actinomycetota bacterium]|nr:hypothetical protein [Actinomycetota bacterium]